MRRRRISHEDVMIAGAFLVGVDVYSIAFVMGRSCNPRGFKVAGTRRYVPTVEAALHRVMAALTDSPWRPSSYQKGRV